MVNPSPRPVLHTDRVLSFAHRGGAALWPENTLLAFRNALDAGCDILESDLRMSRDGVLVLCHDATVDRTTNGVGRVDELNFATLSRLDAGYRFTRDGQSFPFRGQGLTIPTLEEVLAIDPKIRVNVEIKSPGAGVVGRLLDFVELAKAHDRLLVASSHDRPMQDFRAASRGRVATSASRNEAMRFLVASRLRLTSRLKIAYDALQIPPHTQLVDVVDPVLVAAAHRRGIQVHVWTVDAPAEMRRLMDLGVDGIMSDRPDRLVPTIAAHSALDRVSRF